MTDDDTFRLIMGFTFAVFLPFALYHRIRSKTDEKLDRWQEGTFILFGLRLGALPWFLGSLAWMVSPQWMAWSSVPLPVWLRWLGIFLIGLWGILLVWTFQNLGKNLTDTVVTRKEHTLVTTGPYRYVRHPFYLAFFVAVVGGSLVAANWFLFLAACFPIGFLVARTRIEERKLVERFGDEYRDYMAKTGRFVPWCRLESATMSVNTRRVSGRRKLRFETMADLEAEVEWLATVDVQCLGNWSLGQIFSHLARVMLTAVDGAGFRPPLISRLFVLFFKPLVRRWLLEKGMPAGLSHKGIKGLGEVPVAKAMVADSSVTTEEGLAELRTAFERYKSADKLHPHLAFGNISRQDWDRFHFRHAELHLSFVVPK